MSVTVSRGTIVAMRGNAAEYPENSLPAIESAASLGCRFIEIDVQISADGIPVVAHDDGLLRVAGRDQTIASLAAAELAQVVIGEPGRFGERFTSVHLPMLSSALNLLAQHTAVTVFVDLRVGSLTQFGHEQVVPAVLNALRPHYAQCVLISHDLPAIYRARQFSGIRIGWALDSLDGHTQLKFEALQPEFLFGSASMLSTATNLARGPWQWVVHDVEARSDAEDWRARGAALIGTRVLRPLLAALAVA